MAQKERRETVIQKAIEQFENDPLKTIPVPGRIVWPLLESYLGRSSCVNALIPRLTRRPYPTEEPLLEG